MTSTELREREDFVIEATHMLRDRLVPSPVFERLGWDVDVWTEWSNSTPFMRGFRQMMFTKIVPNLKRLGLLTPRVRAAYEKLDLLQFEHHKDSVEEPEAPPPQELVQILELFLKGTANGGAAANGPDASARQAMNRPPFTSSATPFTYDASSEARNAITAPAPPGVESRLIGMK
jgi:hypothetical protein